MYSNKNSQGYVTRNKAQILAFQPGLFRNLLALWKLNAWNSRPIHSISQSCHEYHCSLDKTVQDIKVQPDKLVCLLEPYFTNIGPRDCQEWSCLLEGFISIKEKITC